MTAQTAKHSGSSSRAAMARQRIMEKAAVLFAERGYGNVGINEVGETAGFGKGGLYYHIRSKEHLLVSIISEHMERLIAEAEAVTSQKTTTAQNVAALTGSFAEFLSRNAAAMTLSYREVHSIVEPQNAAHVAKLHAAYREVWETVFLAGSRTKEHRSVAGHEIDAYLAMMFASVFWFGAAPKMATETLATTLAHTVLSAVTAAPCS